MQDEAYEFLQKRVDDERITYTEGQRDNYITAYLTEQARRNKEINQTNGSRHSFSGEQYSFNFVYYNENWINISLMALALYRPRAVVQS